MAKLMHDQHSTAGNFHTNFNLLFNDAAVNLSSSTASGGFLFLSWESLSSARPKIDGEENLEPPQERRNHTAVV